MESTRLPNAMPPKPAQKHIIFGTRVGNRYICYVIIEVFSFDRFSVDSKLNVIKHNTAAGHLPGATHTEDLAYLFR